MSTNIKCDIDDNKRTVDSHINTTKGKPVSCSVSSILSIYPCYGFDN